METKPEVVALRGDEISRELARVVTENFVKSLQRFHSLHGKAAEAGIVSSPASDAFIEAAITAFRASEGVLGQSINQTMLSIVQKAAGGGDKRTLQ